MGNPLPLILMVVGDVYHFGIFKGFEAVFQAFSRGKRVRMHTCICEVVDIYLNAVVGHIAWAYIP